MKLRNERQFEKQVLWLAAETMIYLESTYIILYYVCYMCTYYAILCTRIYHVVQTLYCIYDMGFDIRLFLKCSAIIFRNTLFYNTIIHWFVSTALTSQHTFTIYWLTLSCKLQPSYESCNAENVDLDHPPKESDLIVSKHYSCMILLMAEICTTWTV